MGYQQERRRGLTGDPRPQNSRETVGSPLMLTMDARAQVGETVAKPSRETQRGDRRRTSHVQPHTPPRRPDQSASARQVSALSSCLAIGRGSTLCRFVVAGIKQQWTVVDKQQEEVVAKTAKTSKSKIKTALFLDVDQIERLKALAQKFPGVAMSEHIRRAVTIYLREVEKIKMPTLPGVED